jgi:hypothetical protein
MARKSGNPRKNTNKKISTTDDLPEGATNLYYTSARSQTRTDALVDSDYLQNMANLDADKLNGQNVAYYRKIIEDKNGTRLN